MDDLTDFTAIHSAQYSTYPVTEQMFLLYDR